MIALSYVGQSEYGGDNENYGDESFQKKLAGVGWKSGQAWCGYFQMLVWKEAYTTGNAIVRDSSQEIQNLYNKAKTIPNPQPSQYEELAWKYEKWAPVSKDQAWLTDVKPGDLVIFTSGHGEIALNINRDNKKNITTINSIGGNWGDKVSNHSVNLNEINGFAMVITA